MRSFPAVCIFAACCVASVSASIAAESCDAVESQRPSGDAALLQLSSDGVSRKMRLTSAEGSAPRKRQDEENDPDSENVESEDRASDSAVEGESDNAGPIEEASTEDADEQENIGKANGQVNAGLSNEDAEDEDAVALSEADVVVGDRAKRKKKELHSPRAPAGHKKRIKKTSLFVTGMEQSAPRKRGNEDEEPDSENVASDEEPTSDTGSNADTSNVDASTDNADVQDDIGKANSQVSAGLANEEADGGEVVALSDTSTVVGPLASSQQTSKQTMALSDTSRADVVADFRVERKRSHRKKKQKKRLANEVVDGGEVVALSDTRTVVGPLASSQQTSKQTMALSDTSRADVVADFRVERKRSHRGKKQKKRLANEAVDGGEVVSLSDTRTVVGPLASSQQTGKQAMALSDTSRADVVADFRVERKRWHRQKNQKKRLPSSLVDAGSKSAPRNRDTEDEAPDSENVASEDEHVSSDGGSEISDENVAEASTEGADAQGNIGKANNQVSAGLANEDAERPDALAFAEKRRKQKRVL